MPIGDVDAFCVCGCRPHAEDTPPSDSHTSKQPLGASSSGSSSDSNEQQTESQSGGPKSGLIAAAAALGGVVLLLGGGFVFKDQIKAFLTFFIDVVDDWGPLGYLAYAVVYAGAALPLKSVRCLRVEELPGTRIAASL